MQDFSIISLISNVIKILLVILLIIQSLIPVRKSLIIVLSIFMFISSGALFYSQYALNRLINRDKTEINIISFVVLSDSNLSTVKDCEKAKFGITEQIDGQIANYVQKYLNEQLDKFNLSIASDDISNLESLYNKDITVMVLDNAMRDALIEYDPEFETKTKTIFTIQKSIIKEDTSIQVDTATESFVILISGIDPRPTGAVSEKARSDLNILMIINPRTHNVMTVSIPRDSYVPLACKDGAMDKLTHSGLYGVDCTVKTVEALFGLPINYYIKLNFTAFDKIVSVLGTINVYSQYAFTTTKYTHPDISYTFNQGMNTMNASQALFFSRERHALPNSDVTRGLNQQEVIKGIIKKLIEPSTLLKIEALVNVAAENADTNMPIGSVMKLIQGQIAKNTPWAFASSYLTGTLDKQPTYSMGPSRLLEVYWPNKTSLDALKAQITAMMAATVTTP